MHQVSKILFCHETLHISGIFCAHHQELSAVHVAIGMFYAGYVAAAYIININPFLCVISGFHRGANEIFTLVGIYAEFIDCSLPTFRDNLSGSHLQGSVSPKRTRASA
jgi:hypothetical protein